MDLETKIEAVFGTGGALSKILPGYECRDSQKIMALHVAESLVEGHHLIVEAGTGTGKTLAYLVPSILTEKQVTISTGTKNLQEQIFFKDIPLLKQLFPDIQFKAQLVKGRSNYLCIRRFKSLKNQQQMSLLPEFEDRVLKQIIEWADETQTGDRGELTFLPDRSPLWDQINSRSEYCFYSPCSEGQCFIARLRQLAHDADLLVVNHHLFLSDLILKETEKGSILPDTDAVFFDEAHLLENIATDFFGVHFSNIQIDMLNREIQWLLNMEKIQAPELIESLQKLISRSATFFQELQAINSSDRFRLLPDKIPAPVHTSSFYLMNELELIESLVRDTAFESDIVQEIKEHIIELKDNLRFTISANDPDYVYWTELRDNLQMVKASPVEVADDFRRRILETQRSVIFTSATISTMNTFTFIKSRLGITDAQEAILPSPFIMNKQVALFMDRDLVDPRHENYIAEAARTACSILEISRGRALFLFTSFKNMHEMFDALQKRLRHTLLVQGKESKTTLLQRFRDDVHSVLFATASFWQGIDVPGESLSCVIIDKLPFAVPSEPVIEARIEKIRGNGGNPFMEFQVPAAILTLRQGFGRLIRSKTDSGILALLDSRIFHKRYGQYFLNSFAEYPLATTLDELIRILPEGFKR